MNPRAIAFWILLILGILAAHPAAVRAWIANGSPVCTADGNQESPVIAADGAGGTYISWLDDRLPSPGAPHMQHLGASGGPEPGWPINGLPFGGALCSDGAGGVYAVRETLEVYPLIYARRITAQGTMAAGWPESGVLVNTNYTGGGGVFGALSVIPDGVGGVVIAWKDDRRYSHGTYRFDIYAQRVDSTGALRWQLDGAPVRTSFNGNELDGIVAPVLVSEGNSGAIFAWQDLRTGVYERIYAQRLSALGNALWPVNGVAVDTLPADQQSPTLGSDGRGGAILGWSDTRASASGGGIYAQRFAPNGARLWPGVGTRLSPYGPAPIVTSDASTGAIFAWTARFPRDGRRTGTLYAWRLPYIRKWCWTLLEASALPGRTTATSPPRGLISMLNAWGSTDY